MRTRSSVAVLPVVLFVACSDGTSVEQAVQFTQTDANDVAMVIAGHPAIPADGGLALLAPLREGPQAIGPGPFTINESVTCPGGGTAAITGQGTRTPNQTTRQTTVTWTMTAGHTDCVVRTGADPVSISGSLSGNGTSLWQFPTTQGGSPTLLSYSLTRSGTLTYRKGSKTGTCQATLTTTANQGGTTWTTTGTVCDKQVSNSQKPLGLKT